MKKQTFALFIGLLAVYLYCFPSKAQAYIDPGTGSYIFQVIVAGLFGSIFTIKVYWTKIKKFLSKTFQKKETESNEEK